jgi:hypothetical protein
VYYAQQVRQTQIGVLFNQQKVKVDESHLPTILLSPTYKFNDKVTSYVSFEYNQKAGIAEFINSVPTVVQPERTTALEWGVKTSLPEYNLIFNADIYRMDIHNYQQAVTVLNEYQTLLNANGALAYTSATGNVPLVRAEGVEVDALYRGIKNLTIRFAGAYNNAYYVNFPNSGQPVENAYTGAAPSQNVSGQQLPGNSKITFNLGGDYRVPVLGGKLFHTSWNTMFESRFNSDVSLSSYAWVPAHSISDWSIGLSNPKQTFDVSLITKNLFNNSTPQSITWDSYTPAVQRWVGIMFSGKM